MQLVFPCPRCRQRARCDVGTDPQAVACGACGWKRDVAAGEIDEGKPTKCLLCGCDDLWRQKDFPPALGLAMVGLGILFSTIAWQMYLPLVAIGVLMGFAAIDLVLFLLMPDVLVCYRCGARFRGARPPEEHPKFDLETAERYRQESIRLEEAERSKG